MTTKHEYLQKEWVPNRIRSVTGRLCTFLAHAHTYTRTHTHTYTHTHISWYTHTLRCIQIRIYIEIETPTHQLAPSHTCTGYIPNQELALDELNLEVPCTFDEYVVCDEKVQCCPMPAVDDILESLTNYKDDNDEDDHGEELPSITY